MVSETLQKEFEAARNDKAQLRWYVVKLDHTHYWNLPLLRAYLEKRKVPVAIPSSIHAYYLTSIDIGVHIASFQRSAELTFLHSMPTLDVEVSEETAEAISTWILDGDAEGQESVDYMDWGFIFNKAMETSPAGPSWRFVGVTKNFSGKDRDEDDEFVDQFNALFDHLQGNPPCF